MPGGGPPDGGHAGGRLSGPRSAGAVRRRARLRRGCARAWWAAVPSGTCRHGCRRGRNVQRPSIEVLGVVAEDRRPVRVVFVDHCAKLSGGELALARLLPALQARGVEAHVILGEHGPLEEPAPRHRGDGGGPPSRCPGGRDAPRRGRCQRASVSAAAAGRRARHLRPGSAPPAAETRSRAHQLAQGRPLRRAWPPAWPVCRSSGTSGIGSPTTTCPSRWCGRSGCWPCVLPQVRSSPTPTRRDRHSDGWLRRRWCPARWSTTPTPRAASARGRLEPEPFRVALVGPAGAVEGPGHLPARPSPVRSAAESRARLWWEARCSARRTTPVELLELG